AVPTSYCYTVMQDIVCYRQPMPCWEGRLVGYQGTGDAPPPIVSTMPLPKLAQNAANLPENRLMTTKPAFKQLPGELKQDEKGDTTERMTPVNDAAQGMLPDPSSAP